MLSKALKSSDTFSLDLEIHLKIFQTNLYIGSINISAHLFIKQAEL